MYRYQDLLIKFLSLKSRQVILKSFFSRSNCIGNVLKAIRGLLIKYDEDPGSLATVRKLCQTAKQDLLLLDEILGYLNESLNQFEMPYDINEISDEQATKKKGKGNPRVDIHKRAESK